MSQINVGGKGRMVVEGVVKSPSGEVKGTFTLSDTVTEEQLKKLRETLKQEDKKQ